MTPAEIFDFYFFSVITLFKNFVFWAIVFLIFGSIVWGLTNLFRK